MNFTACLDFSLILIWHSIRTKNSTIFLIAINFTLISHEKFVDFRTCPRVSQLLLLCRMFHCEKIYLRPVSIHRSPQHTEQRQQSDTQMDFSSRTDTFDLFFWGIKHFFISWIFCEESNGNIIRARTKRGTGARKNVRNLLLSVALPPCDICLPCYMCRCTL